MMQIGSAVGYADSERTVEQSSLDGSSGRCGGRRLACYSNYRAERAALYIYIDVTKVKVRHTGTGMLTSQ